MPQQNDFGLQRSLRPELSDRCAPDQPTKITHRKKVSSDSQPCVSHFEFSVGTPYRFVNREYLIITYRTDAAKLRAIVPEPLELNDREPLVKYEFIRMPDSNGFGDYTESGQVIPVSFRGRNGGYAHCMFLNDEGPIAGGRELWGFPKKLAQPTLRTEIDTLLGTLDYGPLRVATGTMGYKHRSADPGQVKAALETPNFLLKIIPHVDGKPRICELVEYHLEEVVLKGA